MKYLVKHTKKHLTRWHYLSSDNKSPYCAGRSSGIVAGQNGWHIEQHDTVPFDALCWHCQAGRKRQHG